MNCVIWGGTGQAKVVRPILESNGHQVVAVFDNDPACIAPFADVALRGNWAAFERWRPRLVEPCGFVVAVGGHRGEDRCELSLRLVEAGLEPLSAVHERAFVSDQSTLGRGSQVMAMAAVAVLAAVGDFCIVNTGASIDHDCRVGRGVHVMPGAVVTGDVTIGEFATVGSGAVVLPGVVIGPGAMIGAGAVVRRNVEPGATVVGLTARPRPAPNPLDSGTCTPS
jgi:sugar O-acyltransferase (sialic acid O-acetyltransferase NeuD family)